MTDALLPSNATAYEKSLAQTTARIADLPVDIGKLWSPDNCPVSLLPWLAWAMSVDEWDSQWSEQTQRDLIRHSAKTHRQKGTVGAVKRALSSLSVTVDFLEWFDNIDDVILAPIHSKQPYTFVFIAWANENPYTSNTVFLNPQLYDAIRKVVNQIKPARAHFDFLVGAKLANELVIGAASTGWSQTARFVNQTVPVQAPAQQTDIDLAITTSGDNLQVSRLTQHTEAVQPPAFASAIDTAIGISRRRYAISRFYLADF